MNGGDYGETPLRCQGRVRIGFCEITVL